MTAPSYLTTVQVQAQLGFATADGTLDFLHRHRLVGLRVGRRLLWRADAVARLIAVLERRSSRN
jgi:hypothetical protein